MVDSVIFVLTFFIEWLCPCNVILYQTIMNNNMITIRGPTSIYNENNNII